MIELALFGFFLGSLLQEHKWRVEEWSSWHPTFKFMGLLTGYAVEYIDIFRFLWRLSTKCALYTTSLIAGSVIIFVYLLIVPLLLLHIYLPQIRWGWCYLHSSMCHFWFKQMNSWPIARVYTYLWLENNINNKYIFERLPAVNLLYGIVLLVVCATVDKNLFIEDFLNTHEACEWLWPALGWCVLLCVWQFNILVGLRPDCPIMHDITPTIKTFKGYTAHYHAFLTWNFFRIHRMPWKFFKLMRLGGIYEFRPEMRNWKTYHDDVSVIWKQRHVSIISILTHDSDTKIWPSLKPMPERTTYHTKNWCGAVWNTEK